MAQAPPPGINLEDDIKGRVIGSVIALMVLSTIAVTMRITARLTSKIPLHWDDYTILVALVSCGRSRPLVSASFLNGK